MEKVPGELGAAGGGETGSCYREGGCGTCALGGGRGRGGGEPGNERQGFRSCQGRGPGKGCCAPGVSGVGLGPGEGGWGQNSGKGSAVAERPGTPGPERGVPQGAGRRRCSGGLWPGFGASPGPGGPGEGESGPAAFPNERPPPPWDLGPSLSPAQSLLELHKRRKALTEPEARYYLRQVVLGCQYLHRNRVIHRDLKLGNLFLNEDLEVKIGEELGLPGAGLQAGGGARRWARGWWAAGGGWALEGSLSRLQSAPHRGRGLVCRLAVYLTPLAASSHPLRSVVCAFVRWFSVLRVSEVKVLVLFRLTCLA